ncbi:MAG: SOS response-associated peptidase [Alphaproteobacteria bacterium]
MCGRYSLTTPVESIAETFRVEERPNLPPRYNVAPTDEVAAVRRRRGGEGRELVMLRWGLVPFWAQDIGIGARLINARAETLGRKPAFREAFGRRHCLVVADGFYEWRKAADGRKQAYRVTLAGGGPFGFAGLWERWKAPDGRMVESCTIVTTDPNPLLRPIHDRMPAIVGPADHDTWLDARVSEAGRLLAPFPAEAMAVYPVSSRVNNVRNDDAACIARDEHPIFAEPAQLKLL